MSSSSVSGVNLGITLGFHLVRAEEMGEAQRRILEDCPERPFHEMRVGETYYHKMYSGSQSVFTVLRMTGSAKQALVSIDGDDVRLHSGAYRRIMFRELSDTLKELRGVTHESIVELARQRGLVIPAVVKRQYPYRFVDVPDRLRADDLYDHTERGAFSWLVDALRTSLWSGITEPADLTVDIVDGWIEGAHRNIARLVDLGVRRQAAGADMAHDFQRYEREFLLCVERWKWLRPFLDVGGVFHVPRSEKE